MGPVEAARLRTQEALAEVFFAIGVGVTAVTGGARVTSVPTAIHVALILVLDVVLAVGVRAHRVGADRALAVVRAETGGVAGTSGAVAAAVDIGLRAVQQVVSTPGNCAEAVVTVLGLTVAVSLAGTIPRAGVADIAAAVSVGLVTVQHLIVAARLDGMTDHVVFASLAANLVGLGAVCTRRLVDALSFGFVANTRSWVDDHVGSRAIVLGRIVAHNTVAATRLHAFTLLATELALGSVYWVVALADDTVPHKLVRDQCVTVACGGGRLETTGIAARLAWIGGPTVSARTDDCKYENGDAPTELSRSVRSHRVDALSLLAQLSSSQSHV